MENNNRNWDESLYVTKEQNFFECAKDAKSRLYIAEGVAIVTAKTYTKFQKRMLKLFFNFEVEDIEPSNNA